MKKRSIFYYFFLAATFSVFYTHFMYFFQGDHEKAFLRLALGMILVGSLLIGKGAGKWK